jgi:hypothetical protein
MRIIERTASGFNSVNENLIEKSIRGKWSNKERLFVVQTNDNRIAVVSLNPLEQLAHLIYKTLHLNYFKNVFDEKNVKVISPRELRTNLNNKHEMLFSSDIEESQFDNIFENKIKNNMSPIAHLVKYINFNIENSHQNINMVGSIDKILTVNIELSNNEKINIEFPYKISHKDLLMQGISLKQLLLKISYEVYLNSFKDSENPEKSAKRVAKSIVLFLY